MSHLGTKFRGCDRESVDRALDRLTNELETVTQSRENLVSQTEELRQQLDALDVKARSLTSRIQAVPENPRYSHLGAQFEEVLRLGEEHAERLTAQTRDEVELIRSAAQSQANQMLREAEDASQKLLADAHSRVDELRLTTETLSADLVVKANIKQAEASEILSSARRGSAALVAQAERDFAEQRSALQRALEVERAELHAFAEETDREGIAAEEALRVRQELSERQNMQRHQDAVERSNLIITAANKHSREVSAKSTEVTAECELLLRNTHVTAEEIVLDARLLAVRMLEQATRRVHLLGEQARSYVDVLLERVVVKTADAREERELLDSYLRLVGDSRPAEMIVAEFEENLHGQLNEIEGSYGNAE